MSNIVRPGVIFAIVLAIILVVLFLFICARFQERAARYVAASRAREERAREILAERAYFYAEAYYWATKAVTPPGTNSECCICLGEFEKQDNGDADDDTITLPTCYHRFPATCIMSWLLLAKKNTCPFCRTCISTTFIRCIYWNFRHLIKPSSQLTVT
ncbi:RING-H2 finger protein ATL64-like [Solanum stenotomum]|uniref:RING-H2 finger protein ATL64-like n=1 Tax=Solanum stenotomum TaxID=172797 RepID=UPI0020D18BFB|nr:RING-H2 finger protein ATL64-like [Solanum stenotomum]